MENEKKDKKNKKKISNTDEKKTQPVKSKQKIQKKIVVNIE